MSTINNIPFDINRTPVEKNAQVKPAVANPVRQSESIHPVAVHNEIQDRRSGSDRRKQQRQMKETKRHLIERRQKPLSSAKAQAIANLNKGSGSIIDLEV